MWATPGENLGYKLLHPFQTQADGSAAGPDRKAVGLEQRIIRGIKWFPFPQQPVE